MSSQKEHQPGKKDEQHTELVPREADISETSDSEAALSGIRRNEDGGDNSLGKDERNEDGGDNSVGKNETKENNSKPDGSVLLISSNNDKHGTPLAHRTAAEDVVCSLLQNVEFSEGKTSEASQKDFAKRPPENEISGTPNKKQKVSPQSVLPSDELSPPSVKLLLQNITLKKNGDELGEKGDDLEEKGDDFEVSSQSSLFSSQTQDRTQADESSVQFMDDPVRVLQLSQESVLAVETFDDDGSSIIPPSPEAYDQVHIIPSTPSVELIEEIIPKKCFEEENEKQGKCSLTETLPCKLTLCETGVKVSEHNVLSPSSHLKSSLCQKITFTEDDATDSNHPCLESTNASSETNNSEKETTYKEKLPECISQEKITPEESRDQQAHSSSYVKEKDLPKQEKKSIKSNNSAGRCYRMLSRREKGLSDATSSRDEPKDKEQEETDAKSAKNITAISHDIEKFDKCESKKLSQGYSSELKDTIVLSDNDSSDNMDKDSDWCLQLTSSEATQIIPALCTENISPVSEDEDMLEVQSAVEYLKTSIAGKRALEDEGNGHIQIKSLNEIKKSVVLSEDSPPQKKPCFQIERPILSSNLSSATDNLSDKPQTAVFSKIRKLGEGNISSPTPSQSSSDSHVERDSVSVEDLQLDEPTSPVAEHTEVNNKNKDDNLLSEKSAVFPEVNILQGTSAGLSDTEKYELASESCQKSPDFIDAKRHSVEGCLESGQTSNEDAIKMPPPSKLAESSEDHHLSSEASFANKASSQIKHFHPEESSLSNLESEEVAAYYYPIKHLRVSIKCLSKIASSKHEVTGEFDFHSDKVGNKGLKEVTRNFVIKHIVRDGKVIDTCGIEKTENLLVRDIQEEEISLLASFSSSSSATQLSRKSSLASGDLADVSSSSSSSKLVSTGTSSFNQSSVSPHSSDRGTCISPRLSLCEKCHSEYESHSSSKLSSNVDKISSVSMKGTLHQDKSVDAENDESFQVKKASYIRSPTLKQTLKSKTKEQEKYKSSTSSASQHSPANVRKRSRKRTEKQVKQHSDLLTKFPPREQLGSTSGDTFSRPSSPEIPLMIPSSTIQSSLTPDINEEQFNSRKILPGVRVMARWRDGYYYPAIVSSQDCDDRWVILFDDGDSRVVWENSLIPIPLLKKGQSVLVQSDDDYSYPGLITSHYKENNQIGYVVERDDGITKRYPRSQVILSADQAACLMSSNLPSPSASSISLDNIIERKRRRTPVSSPITTTPSKRISRFKNKKSGELDPNLDATASAVSDSFEEIDKCSVKVVPSTKVGSTNKLMEEPQIKISPRKRKQDAKKKKDRKPSDS